MTNLLPDVEEGQIVLEKDGVDDFLMETIYPKLPAAKQVKIQTLIRREKYSVKKAMESVGVAILSCKLK